MRGALARQASALTCPPEMAPCQPRGIQSQGRIDQLSGYFEREKHFFGEKKEELLIHYLLVRLLFMHFIFLGFFFSNYYCSRHCVCIYLQGNEKETGLWNEDNH